VAQNPAAPVEVLERLAVDEVFKIQLAVAKNPVTPDTLLARLVNHPDTVIQDAVAEHPNATEEILLQLLDRQRSLILKRQNLPASVLQQLFDDAIAQDSPKAIKEICYRFLQQPHTPEAILAALSQWDTEINPFATVLPNIPIHLSVLWSNWQMMIMYPRFEQSPTTAIHRPTS
jgi:hypothetical protein